MAELTINGQKYKIDADASRNLLSILHDELDLTGTKYGCGEAQCGACTVLIDGYATRACITQLRAAVGKQIITIEGLEKDGQLHPLQEAFLAAEAFQCAFCTSGMIMSGIGLLEKNPQPTEDEIVEYMNGNICRCGTYSRVVKAIGIAAKTMREGSK